MRGIFDAFAAKANLNPGENEALWTRAHRDPSGLYKAFTEFTRSALNRLQQSGVSSGVFSQLEGNEQRAIRAFVLTFGGTSADLDQLQAILGANKDAELFIRDVVGSIVRTDDR